MQLGLADDADLIAAEHEQHVRAQHLDCGIARIEKRVEIGIQIAKPRNTCNAAQLDQILAEDKIIDPILAENALENEMVEPGRANENIVTGSAEQKVVAQSAGQRVVARQAEQGIVADVAAQRVGKVVAGQRGGSGNVVQELFHVGREGVVAIAVNRVDAFVQQFDHAVAHTDVVTVVAEAASQHVGGAVGVALQGVGQSVAGSADGGSTGQGNPFDVCPQRPVGGAVNDIAAFVRQFNDAVAQANVVAVVADAARQHVGGAVAVTAQSIGEFVAGSVDGGTAVQSQAFEIGAQCPVDSAVDGIAAFTKKLDDAVAQVIDGIDVVAQAADQRVGPEPTIQCVVAGQTQQGIVAGIATQRVGEIVAGQCCGGGDIEEQFFHIGREAVVTDAVNRVDAFVRQFDHAVAQADVVAVVAEAASQHVGRAVRIALQRVGEFVAGSVDDGAAGQ